MGILTYPDNQSNGQVYPPLPDFLSAGPDGSTLISDSGQPLGLKWEIPPEAFPSRIAISGTTALVPNNNPVNLDLEGFKSYVLLSVLISHPARCRVYTDNTSRANDAGRSIGSDPTPGSGLIAEVVSVQNNYLQKVTPFTIGGNFDNPVSSTIYLSVTNLSGSTRTIDISLTLLRLEL